MDYREVTACRLCDSTELSLALDLGHTPLANELDGTELFPLRVNRCDDCGHHQLSIAVKPERLWGPNYPYASGTSPVFRAHLEVLADLVAGAKPGMHALEIGSNDGTLIRMLLERGMKAVGVDPSGPRSFQPTLLDMSWPLPADFPKRLYDAILALNVFAHVDDLHSFTAAMKDALAPGGRILIEVGYLLEQLERGQLDTIYHEHLSYHTVRPLVKFFRRHGLEIESVDHIESQGGSIRLTIGHREEIPPYDASAEEVPEFPPVTWGDADLAPGYERVCGYGAPAKLTTLLYSLRRQNCLIDCIGDDNPLKVGKKTPGMHIPIVSVADLLAKEPPAIVVFAWNFFDDIRDKLRRLGYAGDIINPMERVT